MPDSKALRRSVIARNLPDRVLHLMFAASQRLDGWSAPVRQGPPEDGNSRAPATLYMQGRRPEEGGPADAGLVHVARE